MEHFIVRRGVEVKFMRRKSLIIHVHNRDTLIHNACWQYVPASRAVVMHKHPFISTVCAIGISPKKLSHVTSQRDAAWHIPLCQPPVFNNRRGTSKLCYSPCLIPFDVWSDVLPRDPVIVLFIYNAADHA